MRLEDEAKQFNDEYKIIKESGFSCIGIEFGYMLLPVFCGETIGEINSSDDEKLGFAELYDDKKFCGLAKFSQSFILGELNSNLKSNEYLITWNFYKTCYKEQHLIPEKFTKLSLSNLSDEKIEEIKTKIKRNVIKNIKKFYDNQFIVEIPFINISSLVPLLDEAFDRCERLLFTLPVVNKIHGLKERFFVKKNFIVEFTKAYKSKDESVYVKKLRNCHATYSVDWSAENSYSLHWKGIKVKGKLNDSLLEKAKSNEETKEKIIEQLKSDIEKII